MPHDFKVWAPNAKGIAVIVDGGNTPLGRGERGWWTGRVESAGPGTDYAFSIDNGKPLPDPRSPWQPNGVNGPSRLVDHSRFAWTDRNWQARPLSSAVIYELHVGTFTRGGTFESAIEKLDYLVDLGITHIELMPVAEFSGDWGWGYDGVDLYAPHHAYGTPDDLKRLVNACHLQGLAVLLDVVYNHLGPAGNYLNDFGPYFTDAHRTPWGSAVNFDHKNSAEVRRFFLDNAAMWLRDYHLDGLRLDAVHAYHDSSAIHILEQLATEVAALSSQLGRHLVLIAESDLNDPRVVTSVEAGGLGVDAQWGDDFHHALHTVLTGESTGYYRDFGSLSQLAKAIHQAYVYDGIYSEFRDRVHGKPARGLSAHRFLAYAQNHDQIGNRACGERLSHLVSAERLKIAAAFVLTSPFVPMLFEGEEFAASSPFLYFTQHDDDELAHKVSEGRRCEFAAFGWDPSDVPDPQQQSTFQLSKLRWDEVAQEPHASLLAWHKKLIALRRSSPSLCDGAFDRTQVRFDEDARWLGVRRGGVEITCNLAEKRGSVPITIDAVGTISSADDFAIQSGSVELPANSVVILLGEGEASEDDRRQCREHQLQAAAQAV